MLNCIYVYVSATISSKASILLYSSTMSQAFITFTIITRFVYLKTQQNWGGGLVKLELYFSPTSCHFYTAKRTATQAKFFFKTPDIK